MARSLTKKQKGFVKDYMETGNATLAVKNNYDVANDLTARVIGSENLTKPNVIAYLESKAEKAAEFVYQLAESGENENVRLGASKDILDRAGFKPIEKSINLNMNKEAPVSDEDRILANKLKELERNS